MHSLTVIFGPTGTIVQLLYKERASAEKMLGALKSTTEDFATVEDDFGQYAEFRMSSVHSRIIEDLSLAGDAVIERSLQNAKTQHKGNNRAANDPMLKMALNGGALNHPGSPNQAGARRPLI